MTSGAAHEAVEHRRRPATVQTEAAQVSSSYPSWMLGRVSLASPQRVRIFTGHFPSARSFVASGSERKRGAKLRLLTAAAVSVTASASLCRDDLGPLFVEYRWHEARVAIIGWRIC
jgi:hypothetical protein